MTTCCFWWQVREQEGVDAADGVDTLLVYLLAQLEDEPRLAGFAEGRQQAAPGQLASLLQRKGQSDSLALLYTAAGKPAAGLALWKVRPPPPSHSNAASPATNFSSYTLHLYWRT